jgi:Tfp pilus assembly protein PilO
MSRLTLIIIFLSLALLIMLFLIWPQYQELSSLGAEVEGKRIEFQYLEEYFSKLEQLSQKLKQYEVQLAMIDSALPSDSSLTLLSLMDFLQEASSQNGLIFQQFGGSSMTSSKLAGKTVDLSQSETISNIEEIQLGFKVSGSYSALKNFLNALEKSAKIIEVESISLEGEEPFSFNLQITTHSY